MTDNSIITNKIYIQFILVKLSNTFIGIIVFTIMKIKIGNTAELIK